MQYLSAPYIRIPLVLQFFANQEQTANLSSPALMEVLDCVMFEPGQWQAEAIRPRAENIPTTPEENGVMATPLGLLFNELHFAQEAVTGPIEQMVHNVLELDSGRFSPTSSPAALYVIRLVVRVHAYIRCVLQHSDWREKIEERNRVGSRNNAKSNSGGRSEDSEVKSDEDDISWLGGVPGAAGDHPIRTDKKVSEYLNPSYWITVLQLDLPFLLRHHALPRWHTPSQRSKIQISGLGSPIPLFLARVNSVIVASPTKTPKFAANFLG
jgi:hypothetical protein